jgi:hypothetical protein
MMSLAGVYAMLDVHVIAVFQVLIYAGAVMVFMVRDHALDVGTIRSCSAFPAFWYLASRAGAVHRDTAHGYGARFRRFRRARLALGSRISVAFSATTGCIRARVHPARGDRRGARRAPGWAPLISRRCSSSALRYSRWASA